MNVPGRSIQHAVIRYPQRNQSEYDEVFAEAVRRLSASYREYIRRGDEQPASFHLVLTVEEA